MELSKTSFDIDLDKHDNEIPWLKINSCVPSSNAIFKKGQSDGIQNCPSFRWNWMTGEVEQSNFNDPSHPLDKLLDICNKALRRLEEKSEEKYACEVCQRTFARYRDLTNHQKTHTVQKPIPMQEIHPNAHEIQQGYCLRTFFQTGKQRYICTTCGKHFSFMGHLRMHQRIHTSVGLSRVVHFSHAKQF